ncbi:MAG: TonB-dependent receptor plug domain-containing protein [Woeseiaceae bacterium]
MKNGPTTILAAALLLGLCITGHAQDDGGPTDEPELSEITVLERRVANSSPAGSYASVTTLLRFDPAIELQSRGLPEGQADVTVRGGLFENTGFKVGAVTVIDPQTGHYAAELPIDPALLSMPEIQTGIDNSLGGFNSNIATIAYSIPRVNSGGSALLGAGNDDLNFQSLRVARTSSGNAGTELGLQFSASLSEGDGTIDDGDHDFERYNLQLQRAARDSQSDLIIAYQDKFYAWPGAYTGFATLAETDHTKTTLILANHRQEKNSGYWEAGAFYRELDDDYDFDRTTQESGAPGSFDHETRVYGAGIQGLHRGDNWNWHYAAQLTSDKLVASTDLTEGDFTSRNYASLSIVPSINLSRSTDRSVVLRAGASVDISNRDSNEILPVLGVTVQSDENGARQFLSLQYASTSQVPGYTVLNSRPTGLFGGNPDLGREQADELSLSFGQESDEWHANLTAFYRNDDDLVDWTYDSGSAFARQANDVDIEVFGIAVVLGRRWQTLELIAGYTFLDKDADYGSATVDASFYALNFARHRATLAVNYQLNSRLKLRLDSEYREQEENPLRASSDSAFVVSASLAWEPHNGRGLGVALAADNIGDDDYEQFPGTPAVGRQLSLSLRYDW